MNKMSSAGNLLKPEPSSIEDIIGKILYWVGIAFLFFGFTGFFMVVLYPSLYNDEVLQFALTFFYSYLTILGIFLILYHDKIIVKGYRT